MHRPYKQVNFRRDAYLVRHESGKIMAFMFKRKNTDGWWFVFGDGTNLVSDYMLANMSRTGLVRTANNPEYAPKDMMWVPTRADGAQFALANPHYWE